MKTRNSVSLSGQNRISQIVRLEKNHSSIPQEYFGKTFEVTLQNKTNGVIRFDIYWSYNHLFHP
jgi:hypothetical protein